MDETELKEMYQQYAHLIFKRAKYLVHDDDDALEVLQTVFLRIWKYGKGFKRQSDIFTWLYRITTNVAFDFLKKRKKDRVLIYGMDKVLSDTGVNATSELRDEISRLIQNLDQKTRSIVLLYYFENVNQEDVAQLLNISRKTVNKRLMKFKKLFHRLLYDG